MTQALLAEGINATSQPRLCALEALAASARERGKGAHLLTIRTDRPTIPRSRKLPTTRNRFGHIDILVNNAEIGLGAIRPDSWQRPLKFWGVAPDQ